MSIPRMFWWLLIAALLLVFVGVIAPQQLPVTLSKLSLVSVGGVVGYWIDREIFPYARPDKFLPLSDRSPRDPGRDLLAAACMLRRALVVGATMLGVTLGL